MEPVEQEHGRLIHEVLRRVGRNILAFQEIERRLKHLLPYMHPEGSSNGEDSRLKYREQVQGKTLGHLTKAFLESVEWDPACAETPEQGLKWLVDSRNQLVHHLWEIPGTTLLNADGCRALIAHLDAQYDASQRFDRSLRLMARGSEGVRAVRGGRGST